MVIRKLPAFIAHTSKLYTTNQPPPPRDDRLDENTTSPHGALRRVSIDLSQQLRFDQPWAEARK